MCKIRVYCSDCRNLVTSDWGSYCGLSDPESGNYFSPTAKYMECSEANKDNDCKYYLHTRSLIEWLNDLIG